MEEEHVAVPSVAPSLALAVIAGTSTAALVTALAALGRLPHVLVVVGEHMGKEPIA